MERVGDIELHRVPSEKDFRSGEAMFAYPDFRVGRDVLRLACIKYDQVIDCGIIHRGHGFRGVIGNMRRHDDVVQREISMVCRDRLIIEHVDSCYPDMSRLQQFNQYGFGDIDKGRCTEAGIKIQPQALVMLPARRC